MTRREPGRVTIRGVIALLVLDGRSTGTVPSGSYGETQIHVSGAFKLQAKW